MSKHVSEVRFLSDRLYYRGTQIENPHHISIGQGVTVVIGPNGSGKSTLADILAHGWNFRTNVIRSDNPELTVRLLRFTDIHSLTGLSVEYYQQRYEAMMNDDVPTVAELFGSLFGSARGRQIASLFNLRADDRRKINFLSSGELRKLLVANALSESADMLILDNPYIGLDAASRDILDDALKALPAHGVAVVLLVADPADIPDYVNCVVPMQSMKIQQPVDQFQSVKMLRESMYRLFDYAIDLNAVAPPVHNDAAPVDVVAALKNCTVSYGDTPVIEGLNWEIRDGQRWVLSGSNGSGKSTLLSLITADNPKAYINDITLFDRRRGTGESIWDIKRRIGYISPEMALYFNSAPDVLTIVAQGLNDTSGMYVRLTESQIELAQRWLRLLHIEHLAQREFSTLSTGERRLVLLARTFIKQPRLLILDEPFHGLDYARATAIRALINYLAARSDADPASAPLTLIFVTHYLREIPECVTFTKTLSRQ